jgi:hypothetical protein
MLHPHLGGAEDVTGRVKGDAYSADIDRIAVADRLNGRAVSKAMQQQPLRRRRAQVRPGSRAQMVAMSMRNDRAIDRLPRVDVKATCGAIQPVFGRLD